MNTQELLQSGGRIIRLRKGQRTITIAYQRHGDDIVYGATIHRKVNRSDGWTKDGQRQIAIDRLVLDPVVVMAPRDQFDHLGAQDKFVRSCLVTYGCSNTPTPVTSETESAWTRIKSAIQVFFAGGRLV